MEIDYEAINEIDPLSKLEVELEKLSGLFLNSINNLSKYAPLVKRDNEEDLNQSEQNETRLKMEAIENTESNAKNYDELVKNATQEIVQAFDNLETTISYLQAEPNYNKSEDELVETIKQLKTENESSLKVLNEKIKLTDDMISHAKSESNILDHLKRYGR